MPASIYPAVNALQIIIDPEMPRDDISKVKIWVSDQPGDFYPPSQGVLVYDGGPSLNILIPNLDSTKVYKVKYALFSYLDETEYIMSSQLLEDSPLGGAITVQLTTSAQIFNYAANGTTPTPLNTVVQAVTKNLTGPVFYQFLLGNTEVQREISNNYTYTPQLNYSGMPQQLTVKVRNITGPSWTTDILDDTTVLAQDTIFFIGIKPGEDGTDGTSFSIKGSVWTAQDLPGYPDQYNGDAGDAYIVQDTGHLWIWDGVEWGDAGNIVGPEGPPGINTATVALYKKNSSNTTPPDEFSGNFTYTFSNRTLSAGNFNGWTTSPPSLSTGEYLWARYAVASSATAQDTISAGAFSPAIIAGYAGEDGDDGLNAIIGTLSNESANVAANSSGVVDSFIPTEGTFKVFSGTTDISTSCTYILDEGSEIGITAEINETSGVYKVNTMTADSGSVRFKAVLPQQAPYNGLVIIKKFTVTKLKAAVNGTSPIVYNIVSSAPVIVKQSPNSTTSGDFSTITIQGKRYIGNTTSPFGWITIQDNTSAYLVSPQAPHNLVGNDGSDTPYTISLAPTVTTTSYTIRLYTSNTNIGSQTPVDTQQIPIVFKGNTGTPGINTAIVYAYKRSSTVPGNADSDKPGAQTYNFSTNQITTDLLNNWSKTIPTGTDPLYVVAATASSTTNTAAISANAWTNPSKLAQDGLPGNPGLNNATVYAYKRSSTVPGNADSDKPGAQTYSFTTNQITTNLLNNWSKTIPTGTDPLYVVVATASSTSNTDLIEAGEWSNPVKLVENGAQGNPGVNAIVGTLTNSSINIPASSTGTVAPANLSAGNGTFEVYSGTTKITSGITFSKVANTQIGITTNIDANTGAYELTGVSAPIGSVIFKAQLPEAYGSAILERKFTVNRVDAAINGTSPIIYSIVTSASVISKQAVDAATSGDYSVITVIGKKHDGNTSINFGWITVTNSAGVVLTPAAGHNTATSAYILDPADNSGSSSFTIKLYNNSDLSASSLVDTQEIPVIFKGATGTSGINTARIALFAKNSNSTTPPATFSGSFRYNFSESSLSVLSADPGSFNGWSVSAPSITNNEYLWVRYAIAVSNNAWVDIPTTAFSEAVISSIGGINGTSGTWTKYIYAYRKVTRETNSASSVAPSAPSGGIFSIGTLSLTTPPTDWSATQLTNTGGTVYVSRAKVGPTTATTGNINLADNNITWSTPKPATQILENGATWTYDTEIDDSIYSPNYVTAEIYTKSLSTGAFPTSPGTAGSLLIDVISGNQLTAPTNWFTTIALLDASTTFPKENPVFTSTTTIKTTSDRLFYTPTWTTPQYQFKSGGAIASQVITRYLFLNNFTTSTVWQEALGGGLDPNGGNSASFNSTSNFLVVAGRSGIVQYSNNGSSFFNVTTNLPSVTFRGLAASTNYMVLSSTVANSTIYINDLVTSGSNLGTPTQYWTTLNLSTRIGSSVSIYNIIKLPLYSGWLAVGEESNGVGVVLYCNDDNPKIASNWSKISLSWTGTGTLPGLRSVAVTRDSYGNIVAVATGLKGVVLTNTSILYNNWQSRYGPGVASLFSGSDNITINTLAANPSTSPTGVFTLAFAPADQNSSSRVFTIKFSDTGIVEIVSEHSTIADGINTPITIHKLLYSYTFKTLFAATNVGIFVTNSTILSSNAIRSDSWRYLTNSDSGGLLWSSNTIAITRYGYLLSPNASLPTSASPISTNTNLLYYIGGPTALELENCFNRSTPQVGDVVTLQFVPRFISVYRTYTLGLRCTAVGADGTASSATWSVVSSWIDGDMVVDGSITANSLAINSIIAEKIQAGSITADKIAANAITANKIAAGAINADNIDTRNLTVKDSAGTVIFSAGQNLDYARVGGSTRPAANATAGAILNKDRYFSSSSNWVAYGTDAANFTTVSSSNPGTSGTTLVRSPSTLNQSWMNGIERIPIDKTKTYLFKAYARTASVASNRTLYLGVALFDINGSNIPGDGTQWYYAANNVTPPSDWREYTGTFGYGTTKPFPTEAKTMTPLFILSYGPAALGEVIHEVQDIRIQETINSDTFSGGLGINLLRNSGFEHGIAGWSNTYYSFPQTGGVFVEVSHNWNTNTYSLKGAGLAYIRVASTPPVGGIFDFATTDLIPIREGARYEVSALLNAHRCTAKVGIAWYNETGSWGGESQPSESVSFMSDVNTLSDLRFNGVFATAPATAKFARVFIRGTVVSNDPYIFIKNVFFGEAGLTQNSYSNWSPGVALNQITPGNASTYIANAAIGAAQIGSLSLVGDNNFNIASGSTGTRMEMNNKVIKIYNNGVLRIKLGDLSA